MTHLTIHRTSLPLLRPLVSAHGTMNERTVLIVELRAGGHSGWAECGPVPGYSPVTIDEAEAQITSLFERGDGKDLDGLDQQGFLWAEPVRAVLADARLDLMLRASGRALVEHLGGRRTRVPAAAAIALCREPGEASARAAVLLEAGFQRLRLKVAPGFDVEPAAAVVREAGGLPVQVDANQSYAADPGLVCRLDDLGLAAIEQPLSAADLAGHARLARELHTPIALDESLSSLAALHEALDRGAAALMCLKPGHLGGLEATAAAARDCAAAGVDAFAGGMYETAVGRRALAALAAAPGFTVAGDVGPPRTYLARDLADYPELDEDGCVDVWSGPGSGPTPRIPG